MNTLGQLFGNINNLMAFLDIEDKKPQTDTKEELDESPNVIYDDGGQLQIVDFNEIFEEENSEDNNFKLGDLDISELKA